MLIETVDSLIQQQGLKTNKAVDFSGASSLTLPSNAGLIATTAPVIASGLTASGSASNDFSGSTGTFKFPTGAVSGDKRAVISGSGAGPVALLASQSGSRVLFDRAAGIIYTLPTPAVGLYFDFLVTVSVTTNSYKVITDAGTTLLLGTLVNVDTDSSNAVAAWTGNGTTHIAVTQNSASTNATGGLLGSKLRFSCVSTTLWLVEGFIQGAGTVATPFATS